MDDLVKNEEGGDVPMTERIRKANYTASDPAMPGPDTGGLERC